MKRIICFFLIITCLFLLCSCGLKNEPIQNPVTFYYRNPKTKFGTQANLIIGETRESKEHAEDYQYLIEQYLNGPITYDSTSPFPGGTTLAEFSMDASKAYIVLTSQITTLTGSELMVACACITKTVSEMTGVRSVQISTSNGTLDGKESITLTADSFVLWEQENLLTNDHDTANTIPVFKTS